MRSERKRVILGVLAGLVTFFLTAALQMPFPLVFSLPIAVYFGVYLLVRPEWRIGKKRFSQADPQEQQALMQRAYENLITLQYGVNNLTDAGIKNKVEELYSRGVGIYSYLQRHPEKIGEAGGFLTYYLDSAAELVKRYETVLNSKLQGDYMTRVTTDVDRGLQVLIQSFDKQFSHLMRGEVMGIEEAVRTLSETFQMEE